MTKATYYTYTANREIEKRLYNFLKRNKIQYWLRKGYPTYSWQMMLTDKQVGQVSKITGEVHGPY